MRFIPQQRYVSQSEPELGLGLITEVNERMVKVWFRAAQERRQYAPSSAPLRRVAFAVGQAVLLRSGASMVVERVTEADGVLTYHAAEQAIAEMEVADHLSFSQPDERLRAGRVEENVVYALRLEALYRRAQMRSSPARGFVGGRVELIPHQLAIAHAVAERWRPRVLLADEVGLGKTIEAGLILHRLQRTGRVSRILVLVPEALVHQWFVEMLRKFNLRFRIIDEAHCEAVEEHQEETNPFTESTLVIAHVDYLAQTPQRAQQAREAGWDLLVVDEAHHLAWQPDAPSAAYSLVAALAHAAHGLILLTATPQQLGLEGHFARLHLLDPERYPDLATYQAETVRYAAVAQEITALRSQGQPQEAQIQMLLDEQGLGRVIFRNTRRQLGGFPSRKLHLYPLPADAEHPEVKWLAQFLREEPTAKVLLITSTRESAETLHASLQAELQVQAALFHEGLTLLQRDRQAAYFAEPEGARILLCSELGSEGRNFQFAHHLVLLELPENPELLEQRIGRLDRIGQKATIHLHVPYVPGTAQAVLVQWYAEGLQAFTENLPGGQKIALAVAEPLAAALAQPGEARLLKKLLTASQQARTLVQQQLTEGEDRLLALSAPLGPPEILPVLQQLDADAHFESFVLRLGDHCGLVREERGPRTYVWHPGHLVTDSLPSMPADGLTVTFDRQQAVSREDWDFLTWDHPITLGALDYLLGSEGGNAACVRWREAPKAGLWLEAVFVAECIAPAAWHVDRFLPATPVRVVLDHGGGDASQDRALVQGKFTDTEVERLLEVPGLKDLISRLLEQATTLGTGKLPKLIKAAQKRLHAQLTAEITRLEHLQTQRGAVPAGAIPALRQQREELHAALDQTHLRLDSVRLIQGGA